MPKPVRIPIEDPLSFAYRQAIDPIACRYEYPFDPRLAESRRNRPFQRLESPFEMPDAVFIDPNDFDRRKKRDIRRIESQDRIIGSDDRQDSGDFEIDEG